MQSSIDQPPSPSVTVARSHPGRREARPADRTPRPLHRLLRCRQHRALPSKDSSRARLGAKTDALSLCLLGISTGNPPNNHQQTQPSKPTQLLIEKEQAEQRSDQRLDTRRNTRRCRIYSLHGAKEQEIRRNDGSDAQRPDVRPARDVTRRIRRSTKRWKQKGEESQPADEPPVQHPL